MGPASGRALALLLVEAGAAAAAKSIQAAILRCAAVRAGCAARPQISAVAVHRRCSGCCCGVLGDVLSGELCGRGYFGLTCPTAVARPFGCKLHAGGSEPPVVPLCCSCTPPLCAQSTRSCTKRPGPCNASPRDCGSTRARRTWFTRPATCLLESPCSLRRELRSPSPVHE